MKTNNKTIAQDGCMITVSGILVDLYNPKPEDILIGDIAHGLANNCRWNGHTKRFWSVAQHCCMMYDSSPTAEGLKYLFHDAEEAYWGDMIKPLKNKIEQHYPHLLELMRLMRKVIYDKFNIPYIDNKVKQLDFEMLEWEYEYIISSSSKNHITTHWSPTRAKLEWLNRYNESII